MAGLFSNPSGSTGGGWFPVSGWPGTDKPSQQGVNVNNSTYMPRASAGRGPDPGVTVPEKNPAFHANGSEEVVSKAKEKISQAELEQMYHPEDAEGDSHYVDTYGRTVDVVRAKKRKNNKEKEEDE